ncbi:subtilisin-like protein [Neocallimastix lanati (nom. inval.)]|nr:subtilisin-like protein [Neocallimastix sp. JGI-2020a]
MNSYLFIISIVVVFNYFIGMTLAENAYYIVGIKRNDEDNDYDKESIQVQQAIDELVNERMNDIYTIINDNRDTYLLENGEMDEFVNELESTDLIKRHVSNDHGHKMFLFINHKRSLNYSLNKRSDEMIPFKSNVVSHICPIRNYYTVSAYLSNTIVDKVSQLPNVIFVKKSENTEPHYRLDIPFKQSYNNGFNLEEIKKETNWTDVNVQIHNTISGTNFFSHLSLISQNRFQKDLTEEYDNNFYYPKSAGKGIDIYFVDGGFRYSDEKEYDLYTGTEDERTISCDVGFKSNELITIPNPKSCNILLDVEQIQHGNMVMSMAGGAIFGVAKKANLHMITSYYNEIDELNALDYISQHATPYKSVVSISRRLTYAQSTEDKLKELIDNGIIIVNSAGNEHTNCCDKSKPRSYAGYEDLITVGAITNTLNQDMNTIYRPANFSNYGDCVDIFAPAQSIYPACVPFYYKTYNGYNYIEGSGTSSSTPLVAGVIASIMSEHPDIQYDQKLMKQTLIDLSVKDILEDMEPDTPNRFINNGKHVVYSPKKKYHGCGIPSGNVKCSEGCCSADGHCITSDDDHYRELCSIDHGCQSEFGDECLSTSNANADANADANDKAVNDLISDTSNASSEAHPTTTLGQKCGPGYGSCVLQDAEGNYLHVSCCSKEGICGLTREYCGVGCQTDYGRCYAIAFFHS